MDATDGPTDVIWDITYACPLRCTHCYSESGRRPSRQLGRDDLLRLAAAVLRLRPRSVTISGGEPLLVPSVFEVGEQLREGGVDVGVYTGGWTLDAAMAERAAEVFHRVSVSVDGATAEVHDRVRMRRGSFDRAMTALALLDRAVADRRARGLDACTFGVDYTVVESNFHQLEEACVALGSRFEHLGYLLFGAAVPSGLASRPGYVARELLSDEHGRELASRETVTRLRAAARTSLMVGTTDNRILQMHPEQTSAMGFPLLQIEPDGEVRAMAAYEGTVGSLLTEDPARLWRRAVERWRDPFVVAALGPVRTTAQWADAARRIDYHFGSAEVRARIDRRPAYR